jgi:hypothetical protein
VYEYTNVAIPKNTSATPLLNPEQSRVPEEKISSEASANKNMTVTIHQNASSISLLNLSVPQRSNPSPATIPNTHIIKGYIKYKGGNVVRIGLYVKLQEIFDGNIFDIGNAVSSRQDGSFEITYNSERLQNPDEAHLIVQAYYGDKPFTDPVEIKGSLDNSVVLICSPH